MVKKFTCDVCNYTTNRQYNYTLHCDSNKHKLIVDKHKSDDNNDDKYTIFCKFCDKEIRHKKNIQRHLRKCKEKIEYDKNKLDMSTNMNDILTKYTEQNKYIQHLLEDYRELVAQFADTTKSSGRKRQAVNMVYIMNNYNDAKNFDDLMKPPITDEELDQLRKNMVVGSSNLITSRCIKGLSLKERPIHCVDIARHKFLLRKDNKWTIDYYGQLILNSTFNKIYELMTLDISKSKTDTNININTIVRRQTQLVELGQNKMQQKVLKDVIRQLI